MIPQAFAVAIEGKLILTPGSIFMLVALGLCIAIVWRYCKRKT